METVSKNLEHGNVCRKNKLKDTNLIIIKKKHPINIFPYDLQFTGSIWLVYK